MARPRKHPHEKRDQQVKSRYTSVELADIEAQAAAAGISLSEYQYRRTLGHKVKAAPSPITGELIRELNAIGVNLNQIAKYLHTGRGFPDHSGPLLDKFDRLLDEVMEKL